MIRDISDNWLVLILFAAIVAWLWHCSDHAETCVLAKIDRHTMDIGDYCWRPR